jgi:hypothetical protein
MGTWFVLVKPVEALMPVREIPVVPSSTKVPVEMPIKRPWVLSVGDLDVPKPPNLVSIPASPTFMIGSRI